MRDPRGIRSSIRSSIRAINPQEQTWIWGGDLVRKYGRNTDEIREVSRDPSVDDSDEFIRIINRGGLGPPLLMILMNSSV